MHGSREAWNLKVNTGKRLLNSSQKQSKLFCKMSLESLTIGISCSHLSDTLCFTHVQFKFSCLLIYFEMNNNNMAVNDWKSAWHLDLPGK